MRELLENSKTNGFPLFVTIFFILITTFISILAPFSSTITTKLHYLQSNYPPNYSQKGYSNCDLFNGEWIKDLKGSPFYTNETCPTLPTSKDCFLHGRVDKEFLLWRWKPHDCDLPGFEPRTFLRILTHKRVAFIGDSLARNQMESLICLLSKEEAPIDVYKDAKDRTRTWLFPRNNVTLMVLWTRFLIKGIDQGGGVYDLHLDQVDENWGYNVSQGFLDYAIVSSSQWYFKKHYLYHDGNMIGCLYCNGSNLTEYSVSYAVGMAFQTTLRYINGCKKCKNMVTIVRTITPSHFEHGTWKTGGDCERTRPYNKEEANNLLVNSKNKVEMEVRDKQIEAIERAKKGGIKVEAMDITKVMLMRPDGHPSSHWRDKNKKGFNDCVHWCLPGPIDLWNDFLLDLLKRILLLQTN